MKVVVSGSRSVRILPEAAQDALRKLMTLGAQILVGDCEGVDRAVQDFLSEAGYTNVTVYHIGLRPRHNRGFPTVAVSGTRYEDKDIRMCQEAEYGLAIWDGKSPGARRNISRVPKTRVIVAESRQQRRERVSHVVHGLQDFLNAVEEGDLAVEDVSLDLRVGVLKHLRRATTTRQDHSPYQE